MDEDRGTYSPPTEDNLNYTPRRAPSRDQAPLTLIISGIFLVLLLLFVVLFYNSGLNSHGHNPPDVGNSVGDIKDNQVTDAKPLSGDDLNDNGQAKFAPSAEAPELRDDASATVDEAPPPVAPIKGPLPSQANNPAVNGSASTGTAATGDAPDNTPVPGAPHAAIDKALTPSTPAAKPAPVKVASASSTSAAPPPVAAAAGAAMVQIGAFQSMDIANKQYASVASSYGLFLGGTAKHIEKVDVNGATVYRTAFTGFESKDKAKAFCSALKSAGHDCIVK